MAKYVAESRVIASIYPGTVERITLYHGHDPKPTKGRATSYWLPPIPKNKSPFPAGQEERDAFEAKLKSHNVTVKKVNGSWVALLEVSDAFESVFNVLKSESVGKLAAFDTNPVDCDQIANFLIHQWAENMVGIPAGASPGIMIIAGTVPTVEEQKQMLTMQTAFYTDRFQQAETLIAQNQYRELTQVMKDAAVYLDHARTWASPGLSTQTINCPACRQVLPDDAMVCHHCGLRVKALTPELAALNQSGQPAPVKETVPAA